MTGVVTGVVACDMDATRAIPGIGTPHIAQAGPMKVIPAEVEGTQSSFPLPCQNASRTMRLHDDSDDLC